MRPITLVRWTNTTVIEGEGEMSDVQMLTIRDMIKEMGADALDNESQFVAAAEVKTHLMLLLDARVERVMRLLAQATDMRDPKHVFKVGDCLIDDWDVIGDHMTVEWRRYYDDGPTLRRFPMSYLFMADDELGEELESLRIVTQEQFRKRELEVLHTKRDAMDRQIQIIADKVLGRKR